MSDHSKNEESSYPERPSKSQRKRDMTALQKLGETLVKLSAIELAKIPLDDTLAQAITIARTIKEHEAKRRQLQYIGRLMRDTDPLPIEEALDKITSQHNQSKVLFHQVERWRDKLIAEGDKQIEEFLKQFPDTDRQQLRQLTRNAQHAKSGADTELFRFLRKIICG